MEPESQSLDVLSSPFARPIHWLDRDCLTEIFYALIRDHEGEFDIERSYTNLLNLTHVCRGWRTLALDLAELWGDVAFMSSRADVFRILLDRAREAPLYLPPVDLSEEQVLWITEHQERFRVIERAYYYRWDPAALAGKHLPRLEASRFAARPQDSLNHPLLAPMSMPRIETLVFKNFCLPILAPNLRSLSIGSLNKPFKPEDLVTMLNGLPRLSSLDLRDCMPTSFVHDGGRTDLIDLPQMTAFDLKGSCMALTAFFEQLRPRNTDLAVLTTARRGTAPYAGLVHLFHAMRPYLQAPARDAMYVHLDPTDKPYIAAMRHAPDSPESGIIQSYGMRVRETMVAKRAATFFLEEPGVDLLSVYASFFDQLSPSQVRYLHTKRSWHIGPGFSPSNITELFNKSPFADSLRVLEHEIAFTDLQGRFDEARMSYLFPSIPTIWPQMQEMTLIRDACLYVLHYAKGAETLLSWLRAREEAGLSLSVLRLKAEAYDKEALGLESAAMLETWNEIKAITCVVDERAVQPVAAVI